MRLLSIVGMKTGKDHRAMIISDSKRFPSSLLRFIFQGSKSLMLVVLSAIVVFLQVRDYPPLVTVRHQVTSFFSPVGSIVALPFHWMGSLGAYFQSKEDLLGQNERLWLENDQLIRERHTYQQIENDNIKLREALNVQVGLVDDITTIRISHHIYDGYTTVFYSPVSPLGNFHKDDAILTTKGFLVGRVLDGDARYTKIMPLTDCSSRVPVKFESNSQQAILAGDGEPMLRLIHVENPAGVQVGDRLITSGVGGILPEGLPVAVVQSVGSVIKCIPLGTLQDQDFVLALSRTDE
jgi:rod shape-determining protein MreC